MQQTYGAAALPFARAELGVKEDPAGSNDGPRVRVFRLGHRREPWCADFGEWALEQAGWERPDWNWSFCPSWLEAARKCRRGMRLLTSSERPQPGDIALYDWGHDGTADHFGLVETVQSFTSFTAIEGNTSVGNDSNGGQVMRRGRSRSDVAGFIRLPLIPVPLPPGSATLRLVVNGRQWRGWEDAAGPIAWIARNGLAKDTTAAIAWQGDIWRGPQDVANVCANLNRRFLED
ncbi:MAG: CHAP domain-containing protein [Thermoleophilia bacterium]